MHMRLITTVLLTAGAVAVGTGCSVEVRSDDDVATGMFERTLVVAGPVDVDVRTGSGRVTVRPGADGEVRLTGHVRARRGLLSGSADALVRAVEADPPIAQDGNVIRIGDDRRDDLRTVSISYELVVPARTRLAARTGSGSIDIDSLDGVVEAHTGSGRLTMGRIAGAVTAVTGSGAIEVLAASQGLSARTGSGSIRARDLGGVVRADSGSGRIDVSFAAPGDAEITTGSGSVAIDGLHGGLRVRTGSGRVSVAGSPSRAWDIETGSGSVSVQLPADAAFDLDARGTGSIQTSHPVAGSGPPYRNRLQGRVRGGGPRVTLSTGSGSVRID